MPYLLQLIKIIFKPVNALIIASVIIIGLPVALYLINLYKINSDSIRARIFGVDIYRIPSGSMKPVLIPGDYIFISSTAYLRNLPKRKDVIVFNSYISNDSNKKIPYIKRVVAVSGDKIKVEKGEVIVNNQIVTEPYVKEKNKHTQYSQSMPEIIVPIGKLFVMRDNRDSSNDSRIIGAISSNQIIGKATSILYGEDGRTGIEIK